MDSVPIESLETIEEWLDSCDIKYYSSKGRFFFLLLFHFSNIFLIKKLSEISFMLSFYFLSFFILLIPNSHFFPPPHTGNLNWKNVMDSVKADPDTFWSDDFDNGGVGGWEGMLGESESEGEEVDDDVGPDDEAFDSPVESEESEDSEEYEESGSDDGEDDDEDFSGMCVCVCVCVCEDF